MRTIEWRLLLFTILCVTGPGIHAFAQPSHRRSQKAFLGFDRNDYPGDANLPSLRRTFSFTGYWLNVPPGARSNSWLGKRARLRQDGFGFLVLFNGRLDAELKKVRDPAALGRADAESAIASARREGFHPRTFIFLDQEEGGRMLPEQREYIHAWVDGVNHSGFQAGIYCSGIAAPEGNGVNVITAEDIKRNAGTRKIVFWVTNDECPPSPGCALPDNAPSPASSGVNFAKVWQYAQSPKRRDFARGCSNYDPDSNCYPPHLKSRGVFVDLNSALSADPSSGRQ
jgi:hypothetical protein